MISHDIKTVMTDATHVLHVGKNVFYGTKEEYLTSSIGKKLLISEVCIMSEIIRHRRKHQKSKISKRGIASGSCGDI